MDGFGVRLRDLRVAAGKSQQQLGEDVGLSQTAIWNLERRGDRPSAAQIEALAKALSVFPDDLIPEPPGDLQIDESFVLRYAELYESSPAMAAEAAVLREVGDHVRDRRWYTKLELIRVAAWMLPRTASRLDRLSEEEIQTVTSMALAPEAEERLSILMDLPGVRTVLGSTLLTVWDPTRFAIQSGQVVEVLRTASELPDARPPYGRFLWTMRDLAERCVPGDANGLRRLDRALWMYSRVNS